MGVDRTDWLTAKIGPAQPGTRVIVADFSAEVFEATAFIAAAGGRFHVVMSRTEPAVRGGNSAAETATQAMETVRALAMAVGVAAPSDLHSICLEGLGPEVARVREAFQVLQVPLVFDEPSPQLSEAPGTAPVMPPVSPVPQQYRPVPGPQPARSRAVIAVAIAAVVLLAAIVTGVVLTGNSSNDPEYQSIPVGMTSGGAYAHAAFDSVTGLLYVTNSNDRTVSVVDPVKGSATATISLPDDPEGIAIDPALRRLYVVGRGDATTGSPVNGSVSIIDTTKNAVLSTIITGKNSWDVAVDPRTHTVYVVSSTGLQASEKPRQYQNPNPAITNDTSTLSVIDPVTATITATIPVGDNAMAVAMDPDRQTAYIGGHYDRGPQQQSNQGLVIVDLAAQRVTDYVDVGGSSSGILDVAFDPAAAVAYATSRDQIAVVDVVARTLNEAIPNGGHGLLAIDTGRNVLYATDLDTQGIRVIDTKTRKATGTLGGGKTYLIGVTVDPGSHTVYGLSFDTVTVIPR
ncbi:YncE family protein [Nocardia crassostreae]|uniref:YncE family protein n=1 Tax=Nocardia crassostreae TaxID=53428 RepID=UPI00083205BE|nr:YncE family protein [Nocardia crassostreae]